MTISVDITVFGVWIFKTTSREQMIALYQPANAT